MVSSAIPCTYLSFYTWTVPIAVSPCSLWENRRKQTRLSSHRSLPIRSFTFLSLSLSLTLFATRRSIAVGSSRNFQEFSFFGSKSIARFRCKRVFLFFIFLSLFCLPLNSIFSKAFAFVRFGLLLRCIVFNPFQERFEVSVKGLKLIFEFDFFFFITR